MIVSRIFEPQVLRLTGRGPAKVGVCRSSEYPSSPPLLNHRKPRIKAIGKAIIKHDFRGVQRPEIGTA